MSIQLKLLGHASLYIQAGSLKILSDPWLETEMFQICRRFPDPGPIQVEVGAPDLVFLSHHHWDHVHIPTLKKLDLQTPFIIPDNLQLIRILTRLGFENFRAVSAWEQLEIEGVKLVFTQSHVPFGELGLLVIHEDSSIWNLVDTVIEESDIKKVHGFLDDKPLGICLAPYQSYDEMAVLMRKNSEQKDNLMIKNAQILANLQTSLLIPAADGLYYPGNSFMNSKAFLNHPFDFIDCVKEFNEQQRCMVSLPFDEFFIHGESIEVQRSLQLSTKEILEFYDEYRSYKSDLKHIDLDVDLLNDADQLIRFDEILEGWMLSDWFEMYPTDILNFFRKEGMIWFLDVLEADNGFCVDFTTMTTRICSKSNSANARIKMGLKDFLDLYDGRNLLSILIQTPSLVLEGDSSILAYRSLDVLWYAGFQDEQCLDSYLESFS